MTTQPMDKNQFVTQMLFILAGQTLPQLATRREFTELKELNEELFQATEDAWTRYDQMTRDTVNLTVAGAVAQFANQMPRR